MDDIYIHILLHIYCVALNKIPTEKIPAQAGTSHSRSKPTKHHKPHKQFRRAISLRSGLRTTSRPTTSQGLVAHKPPAQANCSTELLAHKPAAQATATSRTSPVAHKPRLGRTRVFFSTTQYIYIYVYIYVVVSRSLLLL